MRRIRHPGVSLTLGLLLLAGVHPGPGTVAARADARSGAPAALAGVQEELATIKTSLDSLTKELQLLRELLAQRLAPPTPPPDRGVQVSLAGRPMLGASEAPLTLIEFSDYQCPFCRQVFETAWPVLKRDYIDTGKLRYVFRDFPLESLHPHARKAAEAARCAGAQGQYWAMHDVLFRNQQALQVGRLKAYARTLGLDAAAFDTCLDQGTYAAAVQQDYADGLAAGVQGTPGFFLGKTRAEDTIEGLPIRGAQPIAVFRQAIERLLGEP